MRKNANQGDVKFYTLIAIVLGVITFFEFAFVEWQGLLFNQDGLILWSLYILSIIKFFLVVMFFMHLYGDHKLLTQLFTAGMVVGSITVALMLMLFTANNMNRYRVEQPVSVVDAHGGGHGGGHGDDAHVEIPVRDFAETLARPAPKSQQYALAPREAIDAGSLNLPTISLPAIDQGVLPSGNLELEPIETAVVETTVVETPVMETTTSITTTQPVVETTQVTETVAAPMTTTTTTTETVTTEAVATDAAVPDDLATLRAQVEALRLELEAMENELPAEGAASAVTTTVQATTAPVTVTTPEATITEVTETVTTTVTQAAPVAAAAAAVTAVTSAATNTSSETVTETVTETISATATTGTVDVSFDAELGNATYSNCLACHQMNGEGIPGAFPPLKGHIANLYNADGGREYLVQVVLYGLMGEINVDGTTYNGVMTPWNSLDDAAVAAVLNHELTSWGNDALLNDFSPITADEVAVQRATPIALADVVKNRVID